MGIEVMVGKVGKGLPMWNVRNMTLSKGTWTSLGIH